MEFNLAFKGLILAILTNYDVQNVLVIQF